MIGHGFGHGFVMHFDEEERADCFALSVVFSYCLVTVSVLWLFLTMPWVGPQCLIAVFLDHTHLVPLGLLIL